MTTSATPPAAGRIVVVAGTRPEVIKLAPVVRALRQQAPPSCRISICAAAQHRELLDSAFDSFALTPDVDLDVMRPAQSPAAVTARVIDGFDRVLITEKCRGVIVQGDTTTAAAATLTAFYRRVPVAHVEAGLRTHRLDEPFPEELNRRLIALAASLHFAPTELARANLLAEGVDPAVVVVTGNTVIDALHDVLTRPASAVVDSHLASLGLSGERGPSSARLRVLVTIHRRESLDSHLDRICEAILDAESSAPARFHFVVTVHPNPAIGPRLRHHLSRCASVCLTPAMDYEAFVHALARCDLVLTDSGGVQEEGAALGRPVLVVRDVTERSEGIDDGVSWLVGRSVAGIREALLTMARDRARLQAMSRVSHVYGDGRAAQRIASRVLDAWAVEPAVTLPT